MSFIVPAVTTVGDVIGASDIYIAEVLTDTIATYEADTPFDFAPTANIAESTETSSTPSYYSDRALWVYNSEGVSTETIVIPYPTAQLEAYILGKTYDKTTGRVYDTGKAKPRYFALLYKTPMSDDNYKYVVWAKGLFSIPSKSHGATKKGQVEPQQLTLTYSAVSTMHKFDIPGEDEPDGIKLVFADTTDVAFNPTGWFDFVQMPGATAPAAKYNVTVNPNNAAQGSVTAVPTGAQPAGTVLTLTATAEAGFTFDHWESDNGGTFAVATDANTTFTTPANDVVITAVFA